MSPTGLLRGPCSKRSCRSCRSTTLRQAWHITVSNHNQALVCVGALYDELFANTYLVSSQAQRWVMCVETRSHPLNRHPFPRYSLTSGG